MRSPTIPTPPPTTPRSRKKISRHARCTANWTTEIFVGVFAYHQIVFKMKRTTGTDLTRCSFLSWVENRQLGFTEGWTNLRRWSGTCKGIANFDETWHECGFQKNIYPCFFFFFFLLAMVDVERVKTILKTTLWGCETYFVKLEILEMTEDTVFWGVNWWN